MSIYISMPFCDVMKALSKKGQISGMQSFITGIIGVVVVLAVGLIVAGELQSSVADCPTAYPNFNVSQNVCWNSDYNVSVGASLASNTTGTLITKLSTVPNWIGIVIVVALASIVLGYFYLKR